MAISTRWVTIIGVAALVGPVTALGQTQPRDDSTPYRQVYDSSQGLFDACGDEALGTLYRQVVRDKVEECPVFSAAVKADFRAWAAGRSVTIEDEDRRARAKGPVPAPGKTKFCQDLRAQAAMADTRRRLEDYGRGKIDANAVIEEPCRRFNPEP